MLFLLGFLSSISQTILLRELSILIKNNEIIIGIFFFFWMIGFSIGTNLFFNLIHSLNINFFYNKKFYYFSLFILEIFLIFILFIIKYLWRYFQFNVNPDFFKIIFINFIFIFPFSLLLGLFFSFYSNSLKTKNVTLAYYFDTLGFLFGGIITTLLLLLKLNSFSIILIILIFISITIQFIIEKEYKLINSIIIIFSIFIFIVNFFLLDKLYKIQFYKSNFNNNLNIKVYNSSYGEITIERKNDLYLVYFHGKLIDNLNIDYENEDIAHIPFIVNNKIKNVLIYGIPNYSLIKQLLFYSNININIYSKYKELNNIYSDYFNTNSSIKFLNNYIQIEKLIPDYDLIYINYSFPQMIYETKYFSKDFIKRIYDNVSENSIICYYLKYEENNIHFKNMKNIIIFQSLITNYFKNIISMPLDKYIILFSKSSIDFDKNKILDINYNFKKLNLIYLNNYLNNERLNQINKLFSNFKETNFKNPDFDIYLNEIYFWIKENLTGSYYLLLVILFFIILIIINKNYSKFLNKNINTNNSLFNIDFKNFINIYIIINSIYFITMEIFILNKFQIIFEYLYLFYGLLISTYMFGLSLGAFIVKFKNLNKINIFLILHIILHILFTLYVYFSNKLNLFFNIISIFMFLFLFSFLYSIILNIIFNLNNKKINFQNIISQFYCADVIGGAVGSIISVLTIIYLFKYNFLFFIILIIIIINNILIYKKIKKLILI